MDVTPRKLTPFFARAIWGGGMDAWRAAPWEDTSEAWEISVREGKASRLTDGTPLPVWIESMGEEAFYGRYIGRVFPMLIKILAPRLTLSVQVHPDDISCRLTGGESKTEAWYVLQAPENAFLYAGLDITADELPQAIAENRVEEALHKVRVQPGDCLFIPGGLVHALTPGVMVYEIQQSSDTTFRVYDWNRTGADGKPRELHIQQAVTAAKDFTDIHPLTAPVEKISGGSERQLLCHRDFGLRELCVDGSMEPPTEGFSALTCIAGSGELCWRNGTGSITRGETWLVPAACGQYSLRGKMKILLAYLPLEEA